jgi:hypothetical protein
MRGITNDDLAWCAQFAEDTGHPRSMVEEYLEQLEGDRLLLRNVIHTAALAGVSPMAVIEAILDRRG